MRSFLLAVCAVVPLAAHAQLPASLSLDDALRLMHERQPALRVAKAQLNAVEARTSETLAPWLPQISLSIGYTRSTANFVARPGALPSSVTSTSGLSLQGYDFLSSGLNVQQLIWDFGQTWNRWDASKVAVEVQQASSRSTAVALDLQLRTAFFNAAAQKALIEVAQATLANQEQHLAQVAGFVRAGTHPDIDLAQSKSDLATARLALINAKNGYAVAKARLNQAMGIEGPTTYDVTVGAETAVDLEGRPVDDVVQVAAKERPELESLEAQVRVQALTLKAIRGGYWPTLSASFGGTAQARSLDAITPNLSIGLNLNWQIYEGGRTRSQVAQAEAQVVQLEAQRDVVRQQVRLDVEQALIDVAGAKEALVVSQEALDASKEQQRLAEGRYKAGAGSILEWGDAQVRVTSAAGQHVQAQFQLATARARLLAALGR